MRSIKKKLLAALAVTAALFGLVGVGAVEAGVYTTQNTCAHATAGNRICYDVSAGTVTAFDNAGAVVAGPTPASASFAAPSRGWIAYDHECNAQPVYVSSGGPATIVAWVTSFSTPGGFGLPATVSISSNWYGNVNVNDTADDVFAWLANSATGYECFIVP